ncbi:TPA: pyridoxine 5'-phosphate synthase [Candidatus Poribacteria bacterium]|nr:pyridoxine 5'-phosphate synthase [Candidatus Poribacteria bacterium]
MIKLSINVDKVATLRQSRGGTQPDPVHAAVVAIQAGADGITAHLRHDRRHIQDRDIELIRQVISHEFNLEMAITQEMIDIALKIKPDQCTLVPERVGEITTENGLDTIAEKNRLPKIIQTLKDAGMRVSIFSRLDEDQIKAAKDVGADRIELYTEPYGHAYGTKNEDYEFKRLVKSAELAEKLGLGLNAGHDLDYRNLEKLKAIPNLLEVSIGHSVFSRAIFIGLENAVKELLAVLRS